MPTKFTYANRRQVLNFGASLATVGAIGSLPGPALSQSKPARLVIADGGGALNEAYKKGYYETFTAKTGIPIVTAAYTNIAKLKAMVEAGNVDIDVLNIDAGEAATAELGGLLEPLDWTLADRSSVLKGVAHDSYVGSEVAALVLVWNTKELPKGPPEKNWSAILDAKKIQGKRGLYKQASQTLEVILLGAGVPGDKLYPLDVDRALAEMEKIRSQIVFWDSGAMSAQLITSGEVAVTCAWNGRVQGPKNDGAPIDFTFDGALLTSGAWIIPKGGRNTKWAQQFFAHVMDPVNQATTAKFINYGPVVTAAYDLISPERRKQLPDPNVGIWQDYDYWAKNTDKIYAQFNEWMIR
jgi:putative spermidine/putrescine transport system substrate-binding protein